MEGQVRAHFIIFNSDKMSASNLAKEPLRSKSTLKSPTKIHSWDSRKPSNSPRVLRYSLKADGVHSEGMYRLWDKPVESRSLIAHKRFEQVTKEVMQEEKCLI